MRNYCDLVTLPKAYKMDEEIIRCFSVEEQKALIVSLDGNRNKALYLTTLGCGLRLDELIGLKWEDIDFTAETISIKRAVSNIAKVENDGTRTWSVV